MTIVELDLSLAGILGAAILFTNAVEILGDRLNLGAGAVGACSRPWARRCRRQ